jgi:AcrR family transcriptional regulator
MTGLSSKGAVRREALLESARWSFTQLGYNAGLRDIARNAGVTAMMIKRYFGSKELLFREVANTVLPVFAEEILKSAPDLTTLCRSIATVLVAEAEPRATPMDGMLIMLRSMNNEVAATILCRRFVAHCGWALPEFIPGSDKAQRTGVFLSVIASFQAMQFVGRTMALSHGEPVAHAERLQALFSAVAEGVT